MLPPDSLEESPELPLDDPLRDDWPLRDDPLMLSDPSDELLEPEPDLPRCCDEELEPDIPLSGDEELEPDIEFCELPPWPSPCDDEPRSRFELLSDPLLAPALLC